MTDAIRCQLLLTVITVLAFCAVGYADYQLVWSDEFDGTSLNTLNWSYDIGNGTNGWGNNELQYYRSQNVSVSGGNLILEVREEPYSGFDFTSGKVHTRDKQWFLYGKVEARAKIPTGGGMWPAFWMMPQYAVYGGWAASGEIDIMEAANDTTWIGGALHFGGAWPDNTYLNDSYSSGNTNFGDDFHIYAIEWEPDQIRWYVDGNLYFTLNSSQWYTNAAPSNPRAPFDEEFYIILNAAVGGNYTQCWDPGCVTDALPQQYLIDYVRVYQDSPNVSPMVSITNPVNNADLPAGDILIQADASDADGTIATVEFYEGSNYLGEDTTAPYSFNWTSVPDGCYTITAKAIDDAGGSGTDTISITVGIGCGQAPFYGSPMMVPARIEAEDFDIGGEGVAYHDGDTGNNGNQYRTLEDVDIEDCSEGGYNTGWTENGEWVEYTIHVPVAGEYTIQTRIASYSSGNAFHFEFDGVDKTGSINIPATGGWQTWTPVSATANLSAGTQVLRFVSTLNDYNVNYFDISANFFIPDCDFDGNGFYFEMEDLLIMCQNWLTAGPGGDADGSGSVDMIDFSECSNFWSP